MNPGCRSALLVLSLLMFAFVLPGSARAVDPHLSGWNSETLDHGFGLGVKQRVRVLVLSVDARASYMRFADANVNIIPLEATAQVGLGMLYAGGGAGYYLMDHGWENQVGASLLLGAGLGLASLGVFGEVLYTWMDGQLNDLGADSLSGLRLNLGVTF